MDVEFPEELARRDARLQAIRAAKAELEARAAKRDAAAQAEYLAKLKARADQTARTGKKLRGKPPAPPRTGVRADDQVNLTDPDARIMPVAGGGFESAGGPHHRVLRISSRLFIRPTLYTLVAIHRAIADYLNKEK